MQLAETEITSRVSKSHGVKIGDWYFISNMTNKDGIQNTYRVVAVYNNSFDVVSYSGNQLVKQSVKYDNIPGIIFCDDNYFEIIFPERYEDGEFSRLQNLEGLLRRFQILELEQLCRDNKIEDRKSRYDKSN